MQVTIEQHQTTVVIQVLETRLDAHNSGELKSEMLAQFEGGKINLVVNLHEVRFVDSSGLGVLVSGFKNASARNGSLKLCCMQQQVKSMFELTRLHRVFDIFATQEEALASFVD